MKKMFVLAAAMMLAGVFVQAQNSFKGTVKYKVESTGEVAIQIPEQVAVAEIKVSGSDLYTKSPIFIASMGAESVLVNNLRMSYCLDLSSILSYLRTDGAEFSYEGSGKIIIENTAKAEDFDSLTIVDKEPGHFYYEYVDGETKKIAGQTAYKMVRHMYDEEGVDHPMTMWYSKEIGPEINVLFGGLKGMPLECTMEQGDGSAITYTAVEVVEGKVKQTDFLLPAGYDTLTPEEAEVFMTEFYEEINLRNGEE